MCRRPYPAYAEGPYGDEPVVAPCRLGHHRGDRQAVHPCHLAGERGREGLATFRDTRCYSSIEVIKAALVDNDRNERTFALTQSLNLYDVDQTKIEGCDRKLEAAVSALTVRGDGDVPARPKARTKRKQVNATSFDVRAAFYGVFGTDLTQIHDLGPSRALRLVTECGTDLQAWKSAKHITSWLCLAPGNKISGGKLLSSRTRRSSSRAAALLRLAATTIGRGDTALPAWWNGWPGRTHVRRWINDIGLSRKRIIEIATETRADHPNPPDVPKALDRFMEGAAQRDA